VFNNTVLTVLMTLLISFCLPLVGSPEEERINRLIQELKDEDSSVRKKAAAALGEIKDDRVVEPLIGALKDKDSSVREKAASAVGEIRDDRAADPLIAALRDKDFKIIVAAYYFFIALGEPGTEDILITALNKYGFVTMAEDFLNCGNSKLEEAGSRWASVHGHRMQTPSLSYRDGPKWGSSR